MKVAEIDFTGCKNLDELHDRISKALDFPEWYGKNWDAFWDLLWSECDVNVLIIKGEKTLAPDFGKHLSVMHELLEDNKRFWAKADSGFSFDYRIVS